MGHRLSCALNILLLSLDFHISLANTNYDFFTEFSGQSSSTALRDQASKPGQTLWTIGVKQGSSGNPLEFAGSATLISRELEKFYIREYDQNSPTPTVPILRSLKEKGEPAQHVQGDLKLIYQKNDLIHLLQFSVPASKDPLETKKIGAITRLRPDAGRYEIGLELGLSKAKQPKTLYRRFYEDEPYIESPAFLLTQEYKLWLEASVSSRLKVASEISNTRRLNIRPDVRGIRILGKLALSDRIFANVNIAQFKEHEKQEPLDGQGYFKFRYSELGLDFEPIFDMLVGITYALIFESESVAPNSGQNRELASDQYGFALNYHGVFQQLGFNASIIRSELGEIQRLFGGNITWNI